mmetsp:Transcript_1737/g.4358  ORF Transcript_1737/g.4358 Transcript_1737/m.4358 type:complete len:107 (+) Transcript_1737:561-881(+)
MVKVNKRSFAIASNDALSLEPYERVITLKDGTTKTQTVQRTSTAVLQQLNNVCMYMDVWGEQRSGVRKIAKRQETTGEAHAWDREKAKPTFDFVAAAAAARAAPTQ